MKMVKNSFLVVLGLIMAASATLAYVGSGNSVFAQLFSSNHPPKDPVPVHTDLLAVRAHLVQDKVLKGSDGQVSVSLTLDAAKIPRSDHRPVDHADLVIVLDRSGSMAGQKLSDARLAVMQLIDRMTAKDRLAIITYSNAVQVVSPLVDMDEAHRHQLKTVVAQVNADGGTNLGAGLKHGIQTLMQTPANGRQRRVILISDGQANQGITDPLELGNMASGAATQNVAVSTVGVGFDFNEILMTTLADHGAGRYYFLEDPKKFALVFDKEFQDARNVAASGVEIRVPLGKGIRLVNAGGYPIQVNDGQAVIRPGDLLSGQQRNLFLTFQVPTDKEEEFLLGEFQVRFNHNGAAHNIATSGQMVLACVKDPGEVTASIDAPAWSARVIQEDYSQLKEAVADAIEKGEKDKAMGQIREYETRNEAINATVGSAVVAENLKTDVQALRQGVEDTFAGPPAAVAEKKKQNSKALQYESYQIRRDKK
ncbi:MAG: VWA domain-containing protein [Deltaproteobacteria bacterium]|nr:VWA domain-containing protein [Deltaproteobacteria bacterium]